MVKFNLNGEARNYSGDPDLMLLKYLREVEGITSAKDGCSSEGVCGACTVEIDGKAKLSCVTKMGTLDGATVLTLEGYDSKTRDILSTSFVEKGAVQCGFCTPGLLVRTKVLLDNNKSPDEKEIVRAISPHICRCTGYKKIVDAVRSASDKRENRLVEKSSFTGKVGERMGKYQAYETALGERPFVDDLRFKDMLYGVLKFSDHPRAKVISIDIKKAEKLKGVIKVFTASDIPGERFQGLIERDWPLMIAEGEVTRYIGDVLAGVVAKDEMTAREAIKLIEVEYDLLPPITDPFKAVESDAEKVHPHFENNILEISKIKRGGDIDVALKSSKYVVSGKYETQRIEHAFLETEATVARPLKDGTLEVYSAGQGVYVDLRQISSILNVEKNMINVIQVSNGGAFGGKEDMTTQGHAALYAFILRKPVKVKLRRDESIRMHPKRHPIFMDYTLGCDDNGKLIALKARIVGDSGAYASVGGKVVERAVGHATGAYEVPIVDIEGIAVYTNNLPCGAMRGFGANQATFAMESSLDELCVKGNFDRYKIRYENALDVGKMTATGQVLKGGVGIRKCLEAIKDEFYKAKYAGIACGIKNTGVGNGMPDSSKVKIVIENKDKVVIHHGWTEMGQGVHTMAKHFFCNETGISPDIVEVKVETREKAEAGMTTSSRGTSLVGNAILDACKKINNDLKDKTLSDLVGKIYLGEWICDFTSPPGEYKNGETITHYSYGYAAQVAILDDSGKIDTIVAAHDAGKVINPMLFEGQIEGSLHMGVGYTLQEDLPSVEGFPKSFKLKDCQILRANETPKFKIIGVEDPDLFGPYGAKGVGEIGLVPTAPAITNALYQFDKIRRRKLPISRKGEK